VLLLLTAAITTTAVSAASTTASDGSSSSSTTDLAIYIDRAFTYLCIMYVFIYLSTGMRRITTFLSTTDRIYDGGPIILQYNIITLITVLQLPTVFSTVTCCTGL
jgi:hypothetical protein